MSSILKVDQLKDSGGNAIITSDGSGNITTGTGMDDQLKRLQNWCNKIKGEVGDKRTSDKRIIRVEKKQVGQNNVYIVSLELNAKSNKKSVFMKRVFYAP